MAKNGNQELIDITGTKIKASEAIHAQLIRPNIVALIKKKYPKWTDDSVISWDNLKVFRRKYIEGIIKKGAGEVSQIQKDVLHSLVEHESVVRNINEEVEKKLTYGQRLSDKLSNFAGSWTFIWIFFTILMLWIVTNSLTRIIKPLDPFPFILLNLILSCLAAIQAPIILMSQNRKETRDRIRGENDYKINLKSELEIRLLHEKLDHLVQTQWKRLLEIQQLQLDMMEGERVRNK